jgi:hypothetical protein
LYQTQSATIKRASAAEAGPEAIQHAPTEMMGTLKHFTGICGAGETTLGSKIAICFTPYTG